MDIQTVSVIVGVFMGLGTFIAGTGFAYAQYKAGGDKYKDSLIDTLKEAITLEQDKNKRLSEERTELIASHQQQITSLTKDFAELKGRFDEQAKKAEEYKALLQGRDPEQQEFMRVVLAEIKKNQATTPAVQTYMRETTVILKEIKEYIKTANGRREKRKKKAQ
jgi:hypothetical protein